MSSAVVNPPAPSSPKLSGRMQQPPTRNVGATAAVPVSAAAAPDAAPSQRGPPSTKPPESVSGSVAPSEGGGGKQALTRADRRAIQEAQRAAKAAGKAGPAPSEGKARGAAVSSSAVSDTSAKPRSDKPAAAAAAAAPVKEPARSGASETGASAVSSEPAHSAGGGGAKPSSSSKSSRVVSLASAEMFSHLQQYKEVTVSSLLTNHKGTHGIHPAVLQLGLRYADGTISGANARCVAFMQTLCLFIKDYSTPDGKSLSRDLTQQV